MGHRDAVALLRKIMEFDFQRERVASEVRFFHAAHEFGGHVIKFDDECRMGGKVFWECVFTSHGFTGARGLHGSGVVPPCKLVVEMSHFPKVAREKFQRTVL